MKNALGTVDHLIYTAVRHLQCDTCAPAADVPCPPAEPNPYPFSRRSDQRHAIAENAFISELVMSNKDEKSTSEEQAAKRRIYFKVPDNWDDLNEEEQDKVLDQFLDAMMQG